MRYGLTPPVIDHMPIDLVEDYIDRKTDDTMTFKDEQELQRWLANQNR